jgi:hypothetical protein
MKRSRSHGRDVGGLRINDKKGVSNAGFCGEHPGGFATPELADRFKGSDQGELSCFWAKQPL